jgi:histidine triad (HIT) family protein
VFEDERVLAFLDINPLAAGHTVLIPKVHAVRFEDLAADDAAALAVSIGPLARRILSAVDRQDYNLLQNNGESAGQVVMHLHVHIIPRRADDGLGYRWRAGSTASGRLAALAGEING